MTQNKTGELREKIFKSLDHYAVAFEVDGRYSPKQWVEEILENCKKAGLKFVDEDAKLPNIRCLPIFTTPTRSITIEVPQWWDDVAMVNYLGRVNQEDMLDENWKKVVEEIEA